MLEAISLSHLSPFVKSFSLLYNNSSWVSVENSKLGPSTMASTGHASYKGTKEDIKDSGQNQKQERTWQNPQ